MVQCICHILYEILKDGILLEDLIRMKKGLRNKKDESMERFSKGDYNNRFKSMKNRMRKNENSLDHIICVVREYMADRDLNGVDYMVA